MDIMPIALSFANALAEMAISRLFSGAAVRL